MPLLFLAVHTFVEDALCREGAWYAYAGRFVFSRPLCSFLGWMRFAYTCCLLLPFLFFLVKISLRLHAES